MGEPCTRPEGIRQWPGAYRPPPTTAAYHTRHPAGHRAQDSERSSERNDTARLVLPIARAGLCSKLRLAQERVTPVRRREGAASLTVRVFLRKAGPKPPRDVVDLRSNALSMGAQRASSGSALNRAMTVACWKRSRSTVSRIKDFPAVSETPLSILFIQQAWRRSWRAVARTAASQCNDRCRSSAGVPSRNTGRGPKAISCRATVARASNPRPPGLCWRQ